MTKKALFILTLTVLVSMLVSASVLAANKSIADKVNGYNVPTREAVSRQIFDRSEELQVLAKTSSRRMPLGSALSDTNLNVGTMVDVTYEDLQIRWNHSRQVALSNVDGQVNAHFAYEEFSSLDSGTVKRSGYNVYDATAGEWPQDQGSGCLLQPSPQRGGVYVGIDVMPDGLAAAYVVSDREGQWADTGATHDFWFQDELNSCGFTNTWIPQATLAGVFSVGTYRGGWPSMVTQLNGTDTITHVAVLEMGGGYSRIVYFRKVGGGATGTWGNGKYIDTTTGLYRIAAEQNGSRVAVIYCQVTDSGRLYGTTYQFLDNDIKYRESTDGGVAWGTVQNITHYDTYRPTAISGAATYNAFEGCYDSNHKLHIVWVAQEVPIKPYRNLWNFGGLQR